MAASAEVFRRLRDGQPAREPVQVVSGSTVYRGTLAAVGHAAHGTSGNRGRLFPWSDAAYSLPAGLIVDCIASSVRGQASTVGDGTIANMAVVALEDFIDDDCDVVGAAAVTDSWKPVYATDDSTYSLTPAAVAVPCGIILNYNGSGTSCRVLFYGVATMQAMIAAGAGATVTEFLGTWDCAAMANGDILTSRILTDAGQITSFFAQVSRAPAGTSGTVTLNLEIGTTNVGPTTPTSIVVATGDTLGEVITSAAITANNTFYPGDALSVEASSTTTMTAGQFNLFMKYRRLPVL